MLHKGLRMQHYRQGKWLLWGLWLVALFGIAEFYNHAENLLFNLEHHAKYSANEPFQYYFSANLEVISMLQILLCIGLATIWGGFSRTNQSLDFTYAMPVKRQHIFLSQWFMGSIHIVGSVTLGFVGQLLLLHTTLLGNYLSTELFVMYYIHQLLVLTGVLTFSIWVGLLCGSFVSQFLVSGILLLLPAGLLDLAQTAVYLPHYALGLHGTGLIWRKMSIFESISFPVKLIDIGNLFRLEQEIGNWNGAKEYYLQMKERYYGAAAFVVPILVSALTLWSTVMLSRKSRNENNGKMLLQPKLHHYFKWGVIVCAFLLGGAFFGEMFGVRYYRPDKSQQDFIRDLFFYYASGLISMGIAYAIVRKVLAARILLGK